MIVGCTNSKEIVEIASTDDVKQLLDSKRQGFMMITNETEVTFLEEVQKALLEKRNLLFNSTSFEITAAKSILTDSVKIFSVQKCDM